jgi:uncharacterized protein YegP (UPF0339 family)
MEYQYWQVKEGQYRGQWWWHLKAANGRIIANAGEAFHNEADCLASIQLVKSSGNAPVRKLS